MNNIFFHQWQNPPRSSRADLVVAAQAIHKDDRASIERWMATGQVQSASNEETSDWYERNAVVWAVVIALWVLVQQIDIET